MVGRFNGKVEWGPRALGNRSILISPSDKKINQLVNIRLNRTEFMPFAPCVLDTRVKDYFVDYDEEDFFAQFMTSTFRVYPKRIKEIEAVVHIDGTARPQIVTKKSNASLYKVLKNFEKKTGIGCLVNTSFNLHEEPIVNNPDDAIRSFLQGAVDVLAINDYLVEKKVKISYENFACDNFFRRRPLKILGSIVTSKQNNHDNFVIVISHETFNEELLKVLLNLNISVKLIIKNKNFFISPLILIIKTILFEKPNIIISYDNYSNFLFFKKFFINNKIKFFCSVHGLIGVFKPWKIIIQRIVYRIANNIIVPSKIVKNKIIKKKIINEKSYYYS